MLMERRKKTAGGPMRITASSGYAIHGLAYLATKDSRETTFLSEISEYFSIPSSYLAKVFQTLARAGLVASFRGAKGGYALARTAEEITLRQVIETFEGPVGVECGLLRSPCDLEDRCEVGKRLSEAQQAYLEALENHSIASIAREFKKHGKIRPHP
jgi:Rrf2 family protein